MPTPLNGNIETGRMRIVEAYHQVLQPEEKYRVAEGLYNDTNESDISVPPLEDLTPGTATAGHVLSGYTGVCNGLNIIGELEIEDGAVNYLEAQLDENGDFSIFYPKGIYTNPSEKLDMPTVMVPQDILADLGGIKPEIVAKNRSDLGIYGTYGSDATAKAENIREGKIAYANGVRLVGTIKVQAASDFTIIGSGENTIIVSWTNPSKGPFKGVIIKQNEEDNYSTATEVYKGYGSSNLPSELSSTAISNLADGTVYYFYFESYSGDLAHSPVIKLEHRFLAT